ncbi:hypothetical protein BH09ACT4_BH09ACT4_01180 [soil metagenome]
MRTSIPIGAFALLFALAGCSVDTPEPIKPDAPDSTEAACEVGHWELDIPEYADQAEAYLLGNRVPIFDYAMAGEGTLDIAADGFIDGVVTLTSTGTIVTPDVSVPIEVPSNYTFSGNWAPGAAQGTIDLTHWAQTADVGGTDPSTVAPFMDFTDVPKVTSACDAESLVLYGPDAPLSALWHRA